MTAASRPGTLDGPEHDGPEHDGSEHDGSEASDRLVHATEVFSAIQGEGALVGTRQVFVRLAGCNIRCAYCDQPESLERRPGPCRLERRAGHRDWEVVPSPLTSSQLVAAADRLGRQLPHHSVSLTGGEPLFQARQAAHVASSLAARGWPVMLETNGTQPTALDRLVHDLAFVSMDVKLPSVDGERVDPGRQRRFLDVALAAGVTTWAKIVIGGDTDPVELEAAVAMVADAATAAPPHAPAPVEVYLQPVTPCGTVEAAPGADLVLELQGRALAIHPFVRVVPQTHKAIGQL